MRYVSSFLTLSLILLATASATASQLVWGDASSILVGSIDGSGTATAILPASGPYSVALDSTLGKVYWSERDDGKIFRGNLNGTGTPKELYTQKSEFAGATRIALDLQDRKIYWTTSGRDKKIQAGNMNGSGSPTDIFNNLLGTGGWFEGIAIDVDNGKLYWAENDPAAIVVGNLDGSGTPVVLFNNGDDGILRPRSIALDVENGLIYWGDSGWATINVCNMDGSGEPITLYGRSDGVNNPFSVAIDTHAYDRTVLSCIESNKNYAPDPGSILVGLASVLTLLVMSNYKKH